MTMLAFREKEHMLTLADYEARIMIYKEQIGTGFIGIGRTLIEAKEAKLVPHGEWESWVERTTGLSIQNAQRCMKAAREIKDGSALARLDMSKALLLLQSGLDEETQEHLAEKALDESATVRELRAEIARQKEDLDVFATAAQAAEQRTAQANIRVTNAEDRLRESIQDGMKLREQLRSAKQDAKTWESQVDMCMERIAELEKQADEAAAAPSGISPEAEARIAELEAELEAAEQREERRAEELAQLRREKNQRAMEAARGLTATALTCTDLTAAVRAFIGSAGVLPQMGATLHGMKAGERETIRQNVEMVATWVDGARRALETIAVEGE